VLAPFDEMVIASQNHIEKSPGLVVFLLPVSVSFLIFFSIIPLFFSVLGRGHGRFFKIRNFFPKIILFWRQK